MSALQASDTLLNLAQIPAAFAGFAALVSVLKERGDRAEALHGILRLRIVISTSVVAVAACLVPVGLAHFNLSDRIVWGVSAALLLALNYGVIASFIKSYKPVQGRFPPDRTAVGLVGALEVIDQGALILILLNIWPGLDFSLYLAALIVNVCQAAFVFLRFVGAEFSAEGG
jgi:hypothetical protein